MWGLNSPFQAQESHALPTELARWPKALYPFIFIAFIIIYNDLFIVAFTLGNLIVEIMFVVFTVEFPALGKELMPALW